MGREKEAKPKKYCKRDSVELYKGLDGWEKGGIKADCPHFKPWTQNFKNAGFRRRAQMGAQFSMYPQCLELCYTVRYTWYVVSTILVLL